MSQAQYSTQEQIENLRIILVDQEWDVENLDKANIYSIIREANFHGLYDAADFIENQMNNGSNKISLVW